MSTNHHHHTSRHRGNGRDDCWTESETETLVNSWGDRYVQLNRGNLRQNDWSDVAAAVNATRDRSKPPRSDVQCKNRIDTLKKKYKLEKSKPEPSKWPLFHRMDELIGAGNGSKKAVVRGAVESISKPNPKPNASLKLKGGLGMGIERVESLDWGNGETAYAELARAIGRIGEVYERMEGLKQEEMMKMEKERMEFTKEVEVRRMNMFVESQVEIEKMKWEKVKKKKKRLSGADSLSSGKKPQR
ncbi:trihelix transcription factor ENAP2-like [Bidens hawaiensis]|uniref:trihelix transcription factor ENAP2-like n=1 Tax=Bidens hawaiensis TaxID=980011 RepID=UPI00404A1C8F